MRLSAKVVATLASALALTSIADRSISSFSSGVSASTAVSSSPLGLTPATMRGARINVARLRRGIRSFPLPSMGGAIRARPAAAESSAMDCMASKDDDVIGDPSLVVTTNVVMDKGKKMEFMKAASKLISESLGKPESYVAIAVQDGVDIIWGGEASPAALCQVVSLGSINLENNKKVSAGVCDMLSDFGIDGTKVYIEFRDVARENMGYNGKTFAG